MKKMEGYSGMKIDPLMKIKRKEKKSIEKANLFETGDINIGDDFDDDDLDEKKKNKKSKHLSVDDFTEEDELEFQKKK